MPIPLSCPCGRPFNIKDEFAGRKVRCPACKSVLIVPQPEPEPEDFGLEVISDEEPAEEEVLDVLPADPSETRRSAIQSAPPERRPDRLPSYQDEDEVSPIRRRNDDVRPPRRRRPKLRLEKPDRQPVLESGWFANTNAGVVGGLLMIGIAVAWLVVGLAGGRLFFYPIFLAVVGFVAIIKGIAGSN